MGIFITLTGALFSHNRGTSVSAPLYTSTAVEDLSAAAGRGTNLPPRPRQSFVAAGFSRASFASYRTSPANLRQPRLRLWFSAGGPQGESNEQHLHGDSEPQARDRLSSKGHAGARGMNICGQHCQEKSDQ